MGLVHAGFRGECSLPGALISGALVIRVGRLWSSGEYRRLRVEWESRRRGLAGSGTLLGPEETDRSLGALMVLGGLFSPGLVSCHTGWDAALLVGVGFGCLVVGWAGCLVVVCELHSGREHLCGQVV